MCLHSWRKLLKESITGVEELPGHLLPAGDLTKVISRYPMRINPYYLGLIKEIGDPLWLQAVPSIDEIKDRICFEDPLDEENLSPVANLVHKYPDRVLFLVNGQCAMYCRFCTRKRKVGSRAMSITGESVEAGLDYIRRTPEVRDVLVSGGDPLLLPDEDLEYILARLRDIPTVEIIRIGSRVPCTLPMRITGNLAAILKKYHPLYINTHFNHPRELTTQAAGACARLADSGIPLGCQTVLLRGVNDNPQTIKDLMRGLLRIRVKPYYLFQGDMTQGTNHFRTTVKTGQEIMRSLIGHVSGMAVPTYAVDAPGGGGKIPLTPAYIHKSNEAGLISSEMVFSNYLGKTCYYSEGQ
ncbi:MAG: KamA family radical SAM protein [Thermodesulfobacteriota bacterium]